MAEAEQLFKMLIMYFFSGWGLITAVDLASDLMNSTERSPIEMGLGIIGSLGMVVYWGMMILHKRKMNKSDIDLKKSIENVEKQRLINIEMERKEIMSRDAETDWKHIMSQHSIRKNIANTNNEDN